MNYSHCIQCHDTIFPLRPSCLLILLTHKYVSLSPLASYFKYLISNYLKTDQSNNLFVRVRLCEHMHFAISKMRCFNFLSTQVCHLTEGEQSFLLTHNTCKGILTTGHFQFLSPIQHSMNECLIDPHCYTGCWIIGDRSSYDLILQEI